MWRGRHTEWRAPAINYTHMLRQDLRWHTSSRWSRDRCAGSGNGAARVPRHGRCSRSRCVWRAACRVLRAACRVSENAGDPRIPSSYGLQWPSEEHKETDVSLRALLEQLQGSKGCTVKDFQKMAKEKLGISFTDDQRGFQVSI